MFVQSIKFVESHHGNTRDIAIYGQESIGATYKLAKMNLAIRSISGNLGEVPADTFFRDQHPDLKADFIMANPPFNLKEWRKAEELIHDPRWAGYEVPPVNNANYAWILHMISKLSENGVAGFVLANGSMSTNTNSEGEIRKKIIENDLVDCMIALPGQLFFTTQIPVCLWFITRNKKADSSRGFRNRHGEALFIDARKMGTLIDRVHSGVVRRGDWGDCPVPTTLGEVKKKMGYMRIGPAFVSLLSWKKLSPMTMCLPPVAMWGRLSWRMMVFYLRRRCLS